MSFLPDELQQKVSGVFPSFSKHFGNLTGGIEDGADSSDEEVLVPSITTTFEMSEFIQADIKEGFVISFGDKKPGNFIPDDGILTDAKVAAMFVADGFEVVCSKDNEVHTYTRLQKRLQKDIWGFEVIKSVKS